MGRLQKGGTSVHARAPSFSPYCLAPISLAETQANKVLADLRYGKYCGQLSKLFDNAYKLAPLDQAALDAKLVKLGGACRFACLRHGEVTRAVGCCA